MIYLRWAEQIAQVALVFYLFGSGLWSRYRWFGVLLSAATIRAVALMNLDFHSVSYATLWAQTEPALILLQLLTVTEAAASVLDDYPKIGALGRRVVAVALIGGTVISGASIFYGSERPIGEPVFVDAVVRAWRWSACACLAAALLLFAWISVFPVSSRPNVKRHLMLLIGFIGIGQGTLAFLLRSQLSEQTIDVMITGGEVIEILCLTAWPFFVTKSGEVRSPVKLRLLREGQEDEYERTMDAFRRGMNTLKEE